MTIHCSYFIQQGLRNFWPYLYQSPARYWSDGQIYYSNRVLLKAGEIAVDPVLRAKLYCKISGFPMWEEWSLDCMPGNSTYFLTQWNKSPIGMMRDNIPLSVLNATLAFLTLMLGIFGKYEVRVTREVYSPQKRKTAIFLYPILEEYAVRCIGGSSILCIASGLY